MRGLEQRGAIVSYVRKVAGDVVGIGAYQRYRERGGDKLTAISPGMLQVMTPLIERNMEGSQKLLLIPENFKNLSIVLSYAVDYGVAVFLIVLASAGNAAEAAALKIVYNAGANVVYDVGKHRTRRPSSAPQT